MSLPPARLGFLWWVGSGAEIAKRTSSRPQWSGGASVTTSSSTSTGTGRGREALLIHFIRGNEWGVGCGPASRHAAERKARSARGGSPTSDRLGPGIEVRRPARRVESRWCLGDLFRTCSGPVRGSGGQVFGGSGVRGTDWHPPLWRWRGARRLEKGYRRPLPWSRGRGEKWGRTATGRSRRAGGPNTSRCARNLFEPC